MFAKFQTEEGSVRLSPENVESVKVRRGEAVARIKMDSGEVHEIMLNEDMDAGEHLGREEHLDRIEESLREAYVPPVVVVPTGGDIDHRQVERFASMFKDALKGNV